MAQVNQFQNQSEHAAQNGQAVANSGIQTNDAVEPATPSQL